MLSRTAYGHAAPSLTKNFFRRLSIFLCCAFLLTPGSLAREPGAGSEPHPAFSASDCGVFQETVSFSSWEQVNRVLGDENLPKEVRDSIRRRYQQAREGGYAGWVTLTLSAAGPDQKEYPFDGGGYQIKNVTAAYEHLPIDEHISAGRSPFFNGSTHSPLSVASAAGRVARQTIDLADMALSMFEALVALFDTPVIMGYSDPLATYLNIKMTYSVTDQFTYVRSEGARQWKLGLSTQRVDVTGGTIHKYYYDSHTHTGYTEVSDLDPAVHALPCGESEHFSAGRDRTAAEHQRMGRKELLTLEILGGAHTVSP